MARSSLRYVPMQMFSLPIEFEHNLAFQLDMAFVHMAFFASFVTFPSQYGARFATNADLEAFVHFWRVIGYFMGIDDRFNLAKDWPIAKLREFFIEIGMHIVFPALIFIDNTSVAMSKAVCQAANVPFVMAVFKQAAGVLNCFKKYP